MMQVARICAIRARPVIKTAATAGTRGEEASTMRMEWGLFSCRNDGMADVPDLKSEAG